MDTQVLVDRRIAQGWKLLSTLSQSGFDVDAAFWIKTSDDGLWRLFIASSAVQPGKVGRVYSEIYDRLTALSDCDLDMSDIKLLATDSPIALDAKAARDRYGGRTVTPYAGTELGRLPIDEAYIYPQKIGNLSPDDVVQTVISLLKRSGGAQPSEITLSDGTSIQAIPKGITGTTSGSRIQLLFVDPATQAERSIAADDVVNIR